jgi:alpha-L-rhamnosidase
MSRHWQTRAAQQSRLLALRNALHRLTVLLALGVIAVPIIHARANPTNVEHVNGIWITHPAASPKGPVVLHFRRDFDLPAIPAQAPIRVSADNRFIIYVNGAWVGAGPARGDPAHWRYERYDIAPYLQSGANHIAAAVWNWGSAAPQAQMSAQTGFLVETEFAAQSYLASGPDWRVRIDGGHKPISPLGRLIKLGWYYAAGPGEIIDAAKHDWSWNDDAPDGGWDQAVPAMQPGSDAPWHLMADPLPAMRFAPIEAGRVVRTDLPGIVEFPAKPVTVPAHQTAHITLDRGAVGAAYPRLIASGGAGAKIRIVYSEALYDQDNHKGDRASVDDRQAIGLEDTFLLDGSTARSFEPFWWRVWRFAEVVVETADAPATLQSFTATETGYPYALKAHFESSDPELDQIWKIGWSTLQVDSHETFMDTAYWEQLQYVGDARVEAIVAYATTADPRLPLQAIDAIRDSRTDAGITQSRYPGRQPQAIPTFSLLWIGMLHDYWMHVPDRRTIADSMPLVRSVLDWFGRYELPNGLLRKVPDWNFVDWIKPEDRTFPSFGPDEASCVTSLVFLGALDEAADLEAALSNNGHAAADRMHGEHLRAAVRENCWDESRGLVADTPAKTIFSQHASALAVLFDVVPKSRQQSVMLKAAPPGSIGVPEGLLPASLYFRFYLARAYAHAGLSDQYIAFLQPWRELLKQHFTTWPEAPEPTRSDSHAWSAHPTAGLLRIVAGIEPASPGFASVRIEPHLGSLTSLTAGLPSPKGQIEVSYMVIDGRVAADVSLPPGLPGDFVWHGRTLPLKQGKTHLRLR